MKNFSKGCLVVAAALAVQLSLSSTVNAQTIKENNINFKISIQDDKDNKDEKIKDSKESSALEVPDNKSEKSEDSKKSNATKVPDNKAQKTEDNKEQKIEDSKKSSALEDPDNKSEKSEDSKKSNATKVPDNKVQKPEDNKAKKPEDIKGDKVQNPGKNETDKSQKTKDTNIPKLMKVNQISPNQIEISYDRDVDVELGSKATNYWVQDTMNDKAKGIASLGKNDKVDARNSLTENKVRVEAKEDSQRTFVLTFSKDIPKGAEYKLIICYVTVEGAPPYNGDNGMMTFVGK
ncbi:hypothetical protein [Clostridium sardiniense]|uniref:hypothetical protein n=1 Tax=Clostridium sardiniense TaxID=29369 RepID=UPI00195A6A24|nr:hypothetical protein [Clostridium sardiniense]MBM7834825.1 DNA mismatch repair ATPase MutL [Clostridium sardiniense]